MGTLPSGLPEYVGDDEDLARFLTQSNHFSASRVKPSAFLPNPKYTNTSIFRMRADPARLSDTWNQNNPGGRPLRGAASARHDMSGPRASTLSRLSPVPRTPTSKAALARERR